MREIEVWVADLRALAEWLPALHPLLSPDEAERAARFRPEPLRDRFVLRRGLLRVLLGRAAGRLPEALVFEHGPHGKPALPGGPAFNLSDCKDDLAIAMGPAGAPGLELGIDVERQRAVPDAAGIAGRFFAAEERAALAALPPDRQAEGFLNGWTRKEAFIKATGAGLSMPLDRFAVDLAPERPARVLRMDPALAAGHAEDWSLFDLRPAPGLIAALAVRGTGWRVRARRVETAGEPFSPP